jgi:hypothetical protein
VQHLTAALLARNGGRGRHQRCFIVSIVTHSRLLPIVAALAHAPVKRRGALTGDGGLRLIGGL